MRNILEFTQFPSKTVSILIFRMLGTICLIVGVITAALDVKFGGFAPIHWFLLAFAGFVAAICGILLRIKILMEKKDQSQLS